MQLFYSLYHTLSLFSIQTLNALRLVYSPDCRVSPVRLYDTDAPSGRKAHPTLHKDMDGSALKGWMDGWVGSIYSHTACDIILHTHTDIIFSFLYSKIESLMHGSKPLYTLDE
jgi:hypothetical protein